MTDQPARGSDPGYCSDDPHGHSWAYHHDGRADLWYRTCQTCRYIDLTAVSQELMASRAVVQTFERIGETLRALQPVLQQVAVQLARVFENLNDAVEGARQARDSTGEGA